MSKSQASIDLSPDLSPLSLPASPPNSPGLLARIDEKDDDYAISSDSDIWSLNTDNGLRDRRSVSSANSSPVESFTMSSDSYFSHQRDSFSEIRGRKLNLTKVTSNSSNGSGAATPTASQSQSVSTRKKERRHSDASVRSSQSAREYYYIDSEIDPLSSPSTLKSPNKRSTSSSNKSAPQRRRRPSSRNRSDGGDGEISETAKIFKNLLIMEDSFRQQHQHQSELIKKYTTFLICMLALSIFSGYRLAFYDDSSYILLLNQITFTISLLTLILFYLNGDYHRTIGRPRKFLTTTNKGIRQLNIRLVKVKVRFFDSCLDTIKFSLLFPTRALKFQVNTVLIIMKPRVLITLKNWLIDFEVKLKTSASNIGVYDVKIVLNPRVFSTATREQWELYRNEFWNKETIRRRKVMLKEKDL